MAFGKGFNEEKLLSTVQFCQMQDGLIYINTNKVIDCV